MFLIQAGKGSYKTAYAVTGLFSRAFMLYIGLNIGNGYKKRLLAPSLNKPCLARAFS